MSGRFKISDLGSRQQETIRKSLLFTSKSLYPTKKKKSRFIPPSKLRAYLIKDQAIHLPFDYVRKSRGSPPNLNLPHRKTSIPFQGELRSHQVQVIQQAQEQLEKKHTCILNSYPGFGKTVCACYLISKLGYRSLVFLSGDLISNWRNSFTSFLPGAKIWEISSQSPTPPQDFDLAICMERRTHYLSEEVIRSVGTVIIDECHTFCTQNRLEKILWTRPRYLIGLSATFERSRDSFHRALEQVLGEEKITRKYPGKLTIYRLNTGVHLDLSQCKDLSGEFQWHQYKELIAESESRNTQITQIAKLLTENHFKVLILAWLDQSHVHPLYQRLKEEIDHVGYRSGDRDRYSDSQVLMGTISKNGTGFDEKQMCYNFTGKRFNVVMVVGSLRSVELLEQMVGRTFRANDPIIIHLVDQDSISQSQWRDCLQYYRTLRGEIKYVKRIDQNLLDQNHSQVIETQERFQPPPPDPPVQRCLYQFTHRSRRADQICGVKVKGEIPFCSTHKKSKMAQEYS